MKFLEKFLAPKKLTMIHTLVCFALIIVMFFLSFGTIFTLEVGKGGEALSGMTEMLDELEAEAGVELPDLEIPETIDVSFPFIIKSAIGGIKVIPVIVDAMKEMTEEVKEMEEALDEDNLKDSAMQNGVEDTVENASEQVDDVKESGQKLADVITQDLVNLICLFMAIINAFTTNFILGLCYFLILVVAIAVPISCIFNTILCVISIIKNREDPGKAFHRVAKSFSAVMNKFPLILLVKVLVPAVNLGAAIIAMLVTIVVGLVVSLAVSRLKGYEKAETKYLNVLQICSVASLVAFLVFFFNMAKTHIMDAFFKNSGKYLADQAVNLVAKKQDMDLVPMALIAVFIVVLVMICNYLVKIVTRIACMSSSKSDSHIFTTVAGLALVAIPFVLMNGNFKLELADAEMSAFITSSVGIVLMLVIEIVLCVLSKSLCSDVPAERRKEIVTGAYVHDTEAVEEAPAEEAPAEEAPAEETPAEETPVEETPVEETENE